MWPLALLRGAVAGAKKLISGSPKPTPSPARTIIRNAPRARVIASAAPKPNKLINPRKPMGLVNPVRESTPGGLAGRSRIQVPDHTGTTDRTFAGEHQQRTGREPTPRPGGPAPGQQGQTWDARAANLAFAGSSLQQLASSFIPGISWTGSVSARGFKGTSLRTVLHYCLAVAFGLARQSRIGSTTYKVDLFHVENRVEVHYSSSTSLAMEWMNVADSLREAVTNVAIDAGVRLMGGASVSGGIGTFNNAVVSNAEKAAKDLLQSVVALNRVLGPAGIWEMAQTDIKTGIPPVTLKIINAPGNTEIQPFTDMANWSDVLKRPLLTRDMAMNPEPTQIPQMDSTHYDLRSLVAQVLHDPGVLPPVPDTNIALASKTLA